MSESNPVTLEQLIDALDLRAVHYYEFTAKLDESKSASADLKPGHVFEADNAWSVRTRHEGLEFGVRFRLEVTLDRVSIIVDLALEYEAEAPLRIARAVAYEFINNVAIMQAFPYLREAVSSLTARVGDHTYVLPIVQRGEVAFEFSGGPDVSG